MRSDGSQLALKHNYPTTQSDGSPKSGVGESPSHLARGLSWFCSGEGKGMQHCEWVRRRWPRFGDTVPWAHFALFFRISFTSP